MQRVYFAFPRGWPGAALLLMRVTIGVTLLVEGGDYVREPNVTIEAFVLGVAALLAGALLLVGLVTLFVGGIVMAAGLGIWLSLLPACTPTLFDSKILVVFAFALLLAIIALGPGTFSIDARMFGRREIVVPYPGARPQR